jgi:hypothetical protein
VLGGFAVTFLSIVLTLADTRRRVGGAVALATTAAACFFLTTLGWAFLASFAAQLQAMAARPGRPRRAVRRRAGPPAPDLLDLPPRGAAADGDARRGGWLRSRQLALHSGVAVLTLLAAGSSCAVRELTSWSPPRGRARLRTSPARPGVRVGCQSVSRYDRAFVRPRP